MISLVDLYYIMMMITFRYGEKKMQNHGGV